MATNSLLQLSNNSNLGPDPNIPSQEARIESNSLYLFLCMKSIVFSSSNLNKKRTATLQRPNSRLSLFLTLFTGSSCKVKKFSCRDNPCHRRFVAASLVQSVYILERDRQEKREGSLALAPPWWNAFHFQLYRPLIDDADSCIFGAIYQLTSTQNNPSSHEAPRYVIAFRGTITKGDAFSRDIELDIHIIKNGLHLTSRFEIAIQAVRHVVATFGSANVWLAGHSLGAAMAMLAGKNMAKTGVFLDSFLFNPPFFSAPIERIKNKKVKHGIRIAGSVITAGLALAMKNNHQTSRSVGTFHALSSWFPRLYVNPSDHICSEYIGYFEHRKRMDDMGAGNIERLATQHSIGGLLLNTMGVQSEEPLHLIPSAILTVNRSRARDFKDAHGIHQWWRSDLHLESKIYNYS